MNTFLAGVGDALLFNANNALIGVAKTLTEDTFDYTITAEEVRGGKGNALFGRYYHDSNLAVTITDAMFNFSYIAASFGTTIEMGGPSLYEEQLTVGASGNSLTLTETPIAFNNTMIGWYKKPADTEWSIGNINGQTMTITGAQANDVYCVKYFYTNENAQSIVVNVDYVPDELHVVIVNDLFSGDVNTGTNNSKVGRLITDIPRLQLDGNQNLSLTSSGATTTSLSGSATAVTSTDTCDDSPYYATITQEIFNTVWQNNVIALAIENSDIEMTANDTATLAVRAVFGGNIASQRKDNSNFTFALETNPQATATGIEIDSSTGVITTTSATSGEAVVSATLTGYGNVPPAYALVTVTA